LAIFFLNIKRSYLHTFYSVQTGRDFTLRQFIDGTNDAIKADAAFNISFHHRKHFEKDIKLWVEQNWTKWEDEKPDWFNEVMKAQIPIEFIPILGDAKKRESVRRASVGADAEGGLGGALRASIRRASVGTTMGGDVARVVPIEEGN
jgi:hypothetical protein